MLWLQTLGQPAADVIRSAQHSSGAFCSSKAESKIFRKSQQNPQLMWTDTANQLRGYLRSVPPRCG
jgi:hypothetical protein